MIRRANLLLPRQSESVLIQKIYGHFKKAPANKKLGVLYVVDSVTRQWLEQARKSGQTLGPSASDGTFAAGVNHVAELLPALMQDILAVAPEDQKVRFLGMLCRTSEHQSISIARVYQTITPYKEQSEQSREDWLSWQNMLATMMHHLYSSVSCVVPVLTYFFPLRQR